MGLPTRLHGDQVLHEVGLIEEYCPKCARTREWEVVENNGKFYKRCITCGTRRKTKEPKASLKTEKIPSSQKINSKKGGNKKKKDKK
jgi:Zn ribbon nucleic-acid-binding protein